MRRRVAWIGAAVALVLGLLLWSSVSRNRQPSSLLLVTIDTLRADRVGAYGSAAGLTPAFDALADQGWLFEETVSAVPLTLPSHATILSGLDPMHHGVRNNGLYAFPQTRETIATRLKDRGYATGAFISAVVLDRKFGLSRGFDVYDDGITRASEGRSVLESERSCRVVTRNAAAWMQSQTGPFFAWVHIYEPHAPYDPPADMAKAHPGNPYDAEVATADRCLGSLMAAAGALRRDHVVTAVIGDHGEGLGEHGESTHGLFLYQSTLKVPMVISGAGVPKAKRRPGLTRTADLAPTLLGLLHSPALEGIDGRNLLEAPDPGEAYAETDYPTGFGWAGLRSWRLAKLKLIDAPRVELYDLATDPNEERNLAASHPKDVDRLRGILRVALASEVKADKKRLSAETEERLRSLGYVAGRASEGGSASLDPKEALPLFQGFERAMAAEARRDYAGSIKELRSLVKSDPTNLTFLRSLASALQRSSHGREALEVLNRAVNIAPQDAAVVHDVAIALAEQGQVIQAIEYEERALAVDPRFADALDHLSTLYAGRGDFAKAKADIEKAVAIDPNHALAWSNRGNIARAQGQPDEAERSYRRALDLSPDLVDALNGLGVLAVEKGKLDDAARLFGRSLDLDPNLGEARLNLAVVEAQRGNKAQAIQLATEAEKGTRDPALRLRARSFLRDLQALSH